MTRWKPLPWVLVGVALLAVSLVAAKLNSPPQSANPDKSATPANPTATGPTVVGTVDTPHGVQAIYPPGVPAMSALTVKKVYAREHEPVSPGDVLVEFDAPGVAHDKSAAEQTVAAAEQAVTAAEWTADQAQKKVTSYALEIEKAKLGVKKATEEFETAKQFRDTARDVLEETLAIKDPLKPGPLTEDEKALRRRRNEGLQKAEAAVRLTEMGVEAAKIEQKRAEAAGSLLEADAQKMNAQVAAAKAQVAAAKALAAKAEAAMEVFKLKAQVAGVIEQLTVSEGMSVGPATRTPMMYLVPTGPRVVRAEVVAEFAHKIDGYIGKPVVIRAGANYADTYSGVVKRVSGAFLPNRFGSDGLVGNSTRVLECYIEVTDPSPPGKPPLRPGLPVRVTFGQ